MINLGEGVDVFENDIYDILHIFEGKVELDSVDLKIDIEPNKQSNNCMIRVWLFDDLVCKEVQISKDEIINKRLIKRAIKLLVYKVMTKRFNCCMPWGSLTGVRPSKIVYDYLSEGYKINDIQQKLVNDFAVSEEKASLICDVVKNQLDVQMNNNEIDLYINIPICPTRCNYCSFISSEYARCKKDIPEYVECLCKELEAVKDLAKSKNLKIKNIYMGGGTPTTLNSDELNVILGHINFDFNEFTVECGRPDTITEDKLEVLKKYGVTRISINPQTLNNETLLRIGRNHSSEEFYEKFEMAKRFGFIINTDLIAGLPEETFEDFKYTIDKIISLNPNNITVHTLAVKRASVLHQEKSKVSTDYIAQMVDYAYKQLISNDYLPYYLYRQKNMLGLYENVGYYKDNSLCEFNIESMEEKASIIACGAGAISKRVFPKETRVERCANVKQIWDYIARIDEMIQRKIDLFCD